MPDKELSVGTRSVNLCAKAMTPPDAKDVAARIVSDFMGQTFSRSQDVADWLQIRIAKAFTHYAAAQLSEHEIKCVREHAHAERLIEWLKNDKRPALTAFTEGPDRQVGYAVEGYAVVRVSEAIDDIALGLRDHEVTQRIRDEALEDAAKVCDRPVSELLVSRRPGYYLAEQIRALKSQPSTRAAKGKA